MPTSPKVLAFMSGFTAKAIRSIAITGMHTTAPRQKLEFCMAECGSAVFSRICAVTNDNIVTATSVPVRSAHDAASLACPCVNALRTVNATSTTASDQAVAFGAPENAKQNTVTAV